MLNFLLDQIRKHFQKNRFKRRHAITFDLPGVYLYQCTHGNMGMLGLTVVGTPDNDNIEEVELSRVAKSVWQRLIGVAGQMSKLFGSQRLGAFTTC